MTRLAILLTGMLDTLNRGSVIPPASYHHKELMACMKEGDKPQQLDPAGAPKLKMTLLEFEAIKVLNTVKAMADDGKLTDLPLETRMHVDALLMMATVRRVGVA